MSVHPLVRFESSWMPSLMFGNNINKTLLSLTSQSPHVLIVIYLWAERNNGKFKYSRDRWEGKIKRERWINRHVCKTYSKCLIHYLKRILLFSFPYCHFHLLWRSQELWVCFINKKFKFKQLSIIHVNSVLGWHKLYANLTLTYSINQTLSKLLLTAPSVLTQ